MTPFEPIGDEPRWHTIYNILTATNVGDIVTYTTLGEALNLHPDKDRRTIQMALRRAAREFLIVDDHALAVIPNQGYRVVEAKEHLQLARRQQRRAGRALVRGHDTIVHVDLNALDVDTRHAFEIVAAAFVQQRAVTDRLNINQRRLAEAVESMRPVIDRSAADIEALKGRLAKVDETATEVAELKEEIRRLRTAHPPDDATA